MKVLKLGILHSGCIARYPAYLVAGLSHWFNPLILQHPLHVVSFSKSPNLFMREKNNSTRLQSPLTINRPLFLLDLLLPVLFYSRLVLNIQVQNVLYMIIPACLFATLP